MLDVAQLMLYHGGMENKTAKTTGERSKSRRDNENAVAVMCGYPSVRKMLTAMITAKGDSLGLDVVCIPTPARGYSTPSLSAIVTPSLRTVYPPVPAASAIDAAIEQG